MVKKGSKKTAGKKKKKQGMTVGGIKKKLSLLKSDEAKINYLKWISKERPGLLKPKTREAVHKVLEDLSNTKAKKELLDEYIKERRLDNAEEIAEKLGKEGKKKLFDAYIKNFPINDVIKKFNLGKKEQERLLYIYASRKWGPEDVKKLAVKLGKEREVFNIYMRKGYLLQADELAMELLGEEEKNKLLNVYIRKGWLDDAEEIAKKLGKKAQKKVFNTYIRKGKFDDAEKLAEKLGDEEKLAEVYEISGKVRKAMALRKKLAKGMYKKRK